jgi:hypothetical protein
MAWLSLAATFAALPLLSCGIDKSGLAPPAPGARDSGKDVVVSGDDVQTPGDEAASAADVAIEHEPSGDGGGARDAQVADRRVADDANAAPDALGGGAGDGGPTPGSIQCASTPCSLASNVCCTCPNCFPPFPTFCSPSFPGCVTGTALKCDDRTDCNGADVCCGVFQSGAFAGTSCQLSCATDAAATGVQFCNVDAECAKGTCQPLTSVPGFTGCM